MLAPGMQKRRRNTSFYNVKAKTLAWRVEWVFKCEDGKRAMIADPRVEESVSPNAALARHIGATQLQPNTAELRLRLRRYVAQFREGAGAPLRYLLKLEVATAGVECYKELDGDQPLSEGLKGTKLVEYPVVYVVLPTDREEYNTTLPAQLEEETSSSEESSSEEESSDDDEEEEEEGGAETEPDAAAAGAEADTGADADAEAAGEAEAAQAEEDLPENW